MPRCPHCGSTQTELVDKHDKHDGLHAAHIAIHGHPVLAGIGWLIKKAGDALADDYECKKCGEKFS